MKTKEIFLQWNSHCTMAWV